MKTMMNKTMWFNILTGLVTFPSMEKYSKVLWRLYNTPFTVANDMDLDHNRIVDAIDLRETYNVTPIGPASILEVMVALVDRCDSTFLYDPRVGARTGLWFENMLISLGLDKYSDDRYNEAAVDYILRRFCNRKYEPNGRGGLFTLREPRDDMRNVDIWMQAMWWITEYELDRDKAKEYYGEEDNNV